MSPSTWLVGEHPATLDPEGRFLLPVPLRNVLNPGRDDRTLMASLEPEGCIAIREVEAWSRFVAELRRLGGTSQRSRRVLLLAAAGSAQVKCDRQGRIRVPDNLLAKLGLDRADEAKREALLVGGFDDVRLWTPAGWQAFEERARESYGADLDELLAPAAPEVPAA